jgi:DNA-binding MarR family transcriptional regulator
MNELNPTLKFFLNLSKIQAVISRRFDNGLGGLGYNEFIILFHLSQAEDEKMRRIDLAEKIGLTASGVTRLLLPMEKVGLVKSEQTQHDARVKEVKLASGGRRRLSEGLERAELLAEEIIDPSLQSSLSKFADILSQLAKSIK